MANQLENIEVMNNSIQRYITEHPVEAKSFLLDIKNFPSSFGEMADILYPDGESLDWITSKNKVYYDKSPLEILSELDERKLCEYVMKMNNGFRYVFEFLNSDVPPFEQVYYETRYAQYKQLGLNNQIILKSKKKKK